MHARVYSWWAFVCESPVRKFRLCSVWVCSHRGWKFPICLLLSIKHSWFYNTTSLSLFVKDASCLAFFSPSFWEEIRQESRIRRIFRQPFAKCRGCVVATPEVRVSTCGSLAGSVRLCLLCLVFWVNHRSIRLYLIGIQQLDLKKLTKDI